MALEMRIMQTQNLSQRMMQSMEILQMNAQELNDYIEKIALENPVVDIENNREQTERSEDLFKKLQWLDQMSEHNRSHLRTMRSKDDEDVQMMEFSEDAGEELISYVMGQLLTAKISDQQYDMLRYMSELLDERGYFSEDPALLAAYFDCETDDILEQLTILQSLEPAGVGARDLRECLLLQLEREEQKDELAVQIVSTCLEPLAKNQLPFIARKLKCEMAAVTAACEHIRKLNPKPGNGFETREVRHYITPDVTVVKLPGQYEILLNDYAYPDIEVNHTYLKMLDGEMDQEAKKYIQDKLRQAEWVKSCIEQRGITLMQIAKQLAVYQEDFFKYGTGHLKPLRLQDLAGMIGVHESTVSRAIREKYLQCQWGCFPLHYFFSRRLQTRQENQGVSKDYVKKMIQNIIDEENKLKPYSDRMIGEMLIERGLVISRRTVAKYREEMGLMDAGGRKQF